jgi:hypothetical protein
MLKFSKLIIVGIISVIAVIAISLFFYNMSVDNKEISLREKFRAQQNVCKTSHDAMWKIISQDAKVSDKYYKDFEAIFTKIATGMLSDEAMFQWLQGFNPQYSTELYKELMNTIKDERTKFKRAQDISADVSREYATYIKTKPTKWFIDNEILDALNYTRYSKDEVKTMNLDLTTAEVVSILTYKPVTSTRTDDAFEKGKDDNVELFN